MLLFRGVLEAIVFFQFFVSLGSTMLSHFTFLTIAAALASATAVFLLRPAKKTLTFSVPRRSIAVAASLAGFLTGFYILRINWGIFDLYCPTSLLGMVTQISHGRFPASFIGIPTLAANYHQGFPIVAGTLSYYVDINAYAAVYFSMILLFFAGSILGHMLILHQTGSTRAAFLYSMLFLLSTSFPEYNIWSYSANTANHYSYLSLLEYMASNSWLLAQIVLFLLFFRISNVMSEKNISPTKDWITLSLLVLSASTVNATFFSVLLFATLPTILLLEIRKQGRNAASSLRNFSLSAIILGAIYYLPRHIPSAFMHSAGYQIPKLQISDMITQPWFIGTYLQYVGPLGLSGVLVASWILVRKRDDIRRVLLSFMIITSFSFPIFFEITNINWWDNLHKFAVLTMLGSSVLLALSPSFIVHAPESWKRTAIAVVCLAATIFPILGDIITKRLSFTMPDFGQTALEAFLEDKGAREKQDILVFPTFVPDGCSQIGVLASKTGSFISGMSVDEFLLAPEIKSGAKAIWINNFTLATRTFDELTPSQFVLIGPETTPLIAQWALQLARDKNLHLAYYPPYILIGSTPAHQTHGSAPDESMNIAGNRTRAFAENPLK